MVQIQPALDLLHMTSTTLADYQRIDRLRERLRHLQFLAWEQPSALTLWIGAGFGKYYGRYPTWSELLTALCDRLEPSDELRLAHSLISAGRLQVAAELLSELHAHAHRNSLNETVCELFSSEDWDATENPLRQISPGIVVSTNYDLMLDDLYPDYRKLDPRQPIDSIFSFCPKLVKLHGSVSDPSSIVLNVSSYARTYTKEFEWFLIHVLQNSTVLFVGASLNAAEPYMRYIKLLKDTGLLKHHHYAILPFAFAGSDAATNRAIADRSNYLETLSIRTLPYVVKDATDHEFMHELIRTLAPPQSADTFAKIISYLNQTLRLPGGAERIGPYLFRLIRSFAPRELEKRPFQNVVAGFLREIREQKRADLVNAWPAEIEELNRMLESYVRSRFATEAQTHGSSAKITEVEKNKAFIFDALRARRAWNRARPRDPRWRTMSIET